ncbi:unnamed protein product [Euphydryas editha]|uniref:Uncharacterized protein n=1 Tax=Euphydryas editha TaxID=104508 RepID=A0AAU9TIK0_EUPED|nr:unnamed protein product [Euphydryas editha]
MDLDRLYEDAAKIDWSMVFNAYHLPAPCLTADIKALQEQKNKDKKRYKTNASLANWEKYKNVRNFCNMVCRNAQRRHIHKSITEETDPGKVWKFLKSLRVGKMKQCIPSNSVDLNDLNSFFTNSCTIHGTTKSNNTLSHLSAIQTPFDFSPFNFCQLSECGVKKNVLAVNYSRM